MSSNDAIAFQSTHEASEIAESFCRYAFGDYDIKITETLGRSRATVYSGSFSIDVYHDDPPDFIKQIEQAEYGFVSNYRMPIFYDKSVTVWVNSSGGWDIPRLRNVILMGVAGLIKSTNYSMALELCEPTRNVLIRHAGELTLMDDEFWTEDRLLVFADIPYTLKSP